MFEKRRRIQDPELRAQVSRQPCAACGRNWRTGQDPDHVSSKGSGGDDVPDNLMPLCRVHHVERHALGVVRMAEKYPGYLRWLTEHDRLDVLERAQARLLT